MFPLCFLTEMKMIACELKDFRHFPTFMNGIGAPA
jgi:hypothetical protein